MDYSSTVYTIILHIHPQSFAAQLVGIPPPPSAWTLRPPTPAPPTLTPWPDDSTLAECCWDDPVQQLQQKRLQENKRGCSPPQTWRGRTGLLTLHTWMKRPTTDCPSSESCNRPSSGSTGVRTELPNLDTGDLVLIWTHAENYTSALQCFFNKDCSSSKSCKRPGSGSTLPDMVTIIITINCIRQYKVPKRLKMASSTNFFNTKHFI